MTLLINNVFEMQEVGMKVHCQTADILKRQDKIKEEGYILENNFYNHLITEYEI